MPAARPAWCAPIWAYAPGKTATLGCPRPPSHAAGDWAFRKPSSSALPENEMLNRHTFVPQVHPKCAAEVHKAAQAVQVRLAPRLHQLDPLPRRLEPADPQIKTKIAHTTQRQRPALFTSTTTLCMVLRYMLQGVAAAV